MYTVQLYPQTTVRVAERPASQTGLVSSRSTYADRELSGVSNKSVHFAVDKSGDVSKETRYYLPTSNGESVYFDLPTSLPEPKEEPTDVVHYELPTSDGSTVYVDVVEPKDLNVPKEARISPLIQERNLRRKLEAQQAVTSYYYNLATQPKTVVKPAESTVTVEVDNGVAVVSVKEKSKKKKSNLKSARSNRSKSVRSTYVLKDARSKRSVRVNTKSTKVSKKGTITVTYKP